MSMSSHTLGLLIGGLVPAMIFGVSNVFMKASAQGGVSLSYLVLLAGLGVVLTGIVLYIVLPDRQFSMQGGGFAFALGIGWSMGLFCATYALQSFDVPVSQLTPLFNMNTLVAVLLALWIFSEWKQVHVPQLLLGSALIIIGGTLVAKA